MPDEQKDREEGRWASPEGADREEGRWASPEDAEVEAHRQVSPRQVSPRSDEFEGEGRQVSPLADDDDEVEAHRWGNHSPDARS